MINKLQPTQKVRKTSPPKKTKLMNMKNIKMQRSLYSCCSLVSSVFAPSAPPFSLLPPNMCLMRVVASGPDPKISSHVKFSVNRAGNKPMPIMKPPPPLLCSPDPPPA